MTSLVFSRPMSSLCSISQAGFGPTHQPLDPSQHLIPGLLLAWNVNSDVSQQVNVRDILVTEPDCQVLKSLLAGYAFLPLPSNPPFSPLSM